MKVKEFCETNKKRTKGFWLCPNICKNMNIAPRLYEEGLDYQNVGSIPQFLLDREVVKGFVEDEILCVIWKND